MTLAFFGKKNRWKNISFCEKIGIENAKETPYEAVKIIT